jgi:hypothetical protein
MEYGTHQEIQRLEQMQHTHQLLENILHQLVLVLVVVDSLVTLTLVKDHSPTRHQAASNPSIHITCHNYASN